MSSSYRDELNWPANRFFPSFRPPQHLTVYNVRHASYEVQISISTLVGLINRPEPRIYLNWRPNDQFWQQELLSTIPTEISTLADDAILDELLTHYLDLVQGYIIYDPACPDSINVATMQAAIHNGVAISPTQAERFQSAPYARPIIDDLRTYHWTNRVQVYHWAFEHLFPHCTPHCIAGLDPKNSVGIRPYLVATRTFIYWLHPLSILPQPSAGWLSERALMKTIFHACAPNTLHLGWFLQEGSGVTLTSHAAIPVIASDYLSNLEVWSAIQPATPVTLPVPPAPDLSSPQPKIYLSFTMSEGDNMQYVQERLLTLWKDPARGSVPIGWPIAPLLQQAAPTLLDYYARTATTNDEFIAGPSGLGYMYPSKWPFTRLAAFAQQSGELMQQLQLSHLEVLDSNFWLHPLLIYRAIAMGAGMALIDEQARQALVHELASYGLRGILSGGGQARASWRKQGDIPVYQNIGIAKTVADTVNMIRQATPAQRPYFINVYVLAWQMGPAELKQVVEQLGSEYEVVLPGTLLAML